MVFSDKGCKFLDPFIIRLFSFIKTVKGGMRSFFSYFLCVEMKVDYKVG